MATRFFQLAIAALAGVSMTTLALAATPLRAHNQQEWSPLRRPMHPAAYWQRHPGGPGGMPCLDGPLFDPATVTTLAGTVTQVNRYGGHRGVFVVMTTAEETVEVHLGPDWYLESQGFEVIPNSSIEVTGFRSRFNDRSMVMASEVKQGDRVLQLRDANGYPLWMGQGFPAN